MASRRKASTPCMIRPEQTVEQDDPEEMEVSIDRPEEEAPVDMDQPKDEHLFGAVDPEQHGVTDQESPAAPESPKPQKRQQGGYECKYCTFSTQKLSMFKEHVDTQHPNVILNPLYLCAVCNFNTKKFDTLTEHNDRCHPGESNFKFKRLKLNNQTILEQTIEGGSNAVVYNSAPAAGPKASSLAKPADAAAKRPATDTPPPPPQLAVRLTSDPGRKHVAALNGTVLFPEAAVLKDGLSHIMPALQRPPNYSLVPKVAVPLDTAKYNASLDGNLTLIASFHKFPYPTQAELSWLTAASKHPEDQIKVWFTTQRLKQGISWSPEEVEEARKKMFNGTIQTGHQTITVMPAQLTTTSSTRAPQASALPCPSPRPYLQPLSCHRMGQTSLVLTPVVNGSSITCAPITLTLANKVAQSIKRPLATPSVVATEIKRPSIIQTIQATAASTTTSTLTPTALPKPIVFAADSSKTPDQLASLRASYSGCAFPEEEEVYRLIETTGLSRGEIKKWFTHQRLLNLKTSTSTPPPTLPLTLPLTLPPTLPLTLPLTLTPLLVKKEEAAPAPSDGPARQAAVPVQFPLLERVKGKTTEQLKTLEESFQRSGGPGEEELDRLVLDTRLSKTEIACWFSERTALRDNMEKALQNSLASRKNPERSPAHGAGAAAAAAAAIAAAAATATAAAAGGGGGGLVLNGGGTSSREESETSSVQTLRSSPLPPVLAAPAVPEPLDARCLALLREVFCRTQWPSPEEYIQLEVQTGLVRTNIVRWFKEHRSALKTHGTLEWMEEGRKQGGSPGPQNGQSSSSSSLSSSSSSSSSASAVEEKVLDQAGPGVQVKTLKVSGEEDSDKPAVSEKSKLSNQDIVQWFTNKLGQSMSDLSRTRPDQTSSPSTDRGRWVKVTMAVGDEGKAGLERPRLGSDADVLPLEHSGRVTG